MKAEARQVAVRRTAIAAGLIGLFANTQLARADTITRTNLYVQGSWASSPGLSNGQVQTILADDAGNTPPFLVQTSNAYDGNGNYLSTTITSGNYAGAASFPTRTKSVTYDSTGTFPIKQTNELGQVVNRTFDPATGNKLSETDTNGLTTTWRYDSFGRQTLATYATGNQTKTTYSYCNGVAGGTASCPINAVTLTQDTPYAADGVTQNGPQITTYINVLGRIVRTTTQGFDGVSLIQVDTIYDSQGRVYQKSRPYYPSQTPQWVTYSYDALGRLVATAFPDSTQTSISYSGLIKVETNALGNTRTTVTNSQGQIVQVTDAQGNTLNYKYNAAGLLTQTTDPKGNTVSMTYDILGHRTQMVDADLGTWNYTYNLLGDLLTQTDAKGNTKTTTYDLVRRVTSTAEPDLNTTFTYDSCTKGVGQLCNTTANNGYVRTQSFDSFGRPSSTATTIDTAYTASKTYDANGRLATQTYPNGVSVKYVYTTLGYLQQVRDNVSNTLYWQANSKDAEGHLLQQTYGNNITTQLVYNVSNGHLVNVYAGSGNAVQNLTYTYDANGNLLTRADGNQNLSESFLYDTLNRVGSNTVNSSGAGIYSQNYGYDSIGNINSRSDLGVYSYGGTNAAPHAVASVALATGGSQQYSYDANGNQVQEVVKDASGNVINTAGRSEIYTSYNMPKSITWPGGSLAFTYNSNHQRAKMVGPNATTIYLHPDNEGGLLYEKDINTNGSVEHRNFITANGSVIALIKQEVVGSITTTNVLYMHRDHLGSVSAVTDVNGNLLEQLGYEAYGKRRFVNGASDPNNTVKGINTNRGYTNHEELDAVGLVNMNGRIYDPIVARFVSADPKVPNPGEIQSFNRYAYTRNNPLKFFDPSGFDEKDDIDDGSYSEGGGGGGGGGSGGDNGGDNGRGGPSCNPSDPTDCPDPQVVTVTSPPTGDGDGGGGGDDCDPNHDGGDGIVGPDPIDPDPIGGIETGRMPRPKFETRTTRPPIVPRTGARIPFTITFVPAPDPAHTPINDANCQALGGDWCYERRPDPQAWNACIAACMDTFNPGFTTPILGAVGAVGAAVSPGTIIGKVCGKIGAIAGAWAVGTYVGCVASCNGDPTSYK